MQRLAIDFNNQQQAAGQRTTPVVSAQTPNLLGPATVDETGNVGYKDQNGAFVPTDQNKHVVLTDPNTNTPNVYARTDSTNEGMASAAGRLIGTGMGAGNIEVSQAIPSAVTAAQRLGVDIPKAIATDKPFVQFAGQVLAKAPGGGPLAEAIPKSIEQLKGSVGQAAELAGGNVNPAAAGEGFTSGVQNFFKPAVKARTTEAYDRVASLVDQNKLTPLTNTQTAIADITSRRQASGIGDVGKAVQTVTGGAERQGGLTFNGVKDLRTHVGELLDTGVFPEGMSQGELRRIYGSLSEDLKASALNTGGEKAVAALGRANDLHKKFSDWKDSLQKVLGTQSRSGEGVYQSIIRMAGIGASADQKTLDLAKAAVPPDAWQNIASTAISTLGKSRNGEWSPAAFLTDYRNLSDQGKRILFGGAGSGKVVPFLNDIADVSSKFVKAGKLANTSGTAGHNVLYTVGGMAAAGMAHGSFVEPITAASGLFGINVMARILAAPATAASMARWANVYDRVVSNPGPSGMAALSRVSREFVSTVNGSLGTKVAPDSLMRAVQTPSGANASQNQKTNERLPSQ